MATVPHTPTPTPPDLTNWRTLILYILVAVASALGSAGGVSICQPGQGGGCQCHSLEEKEPQMNTDRHSTDI